MGRREIREQIFKLLFRVEFNQLAEMPEQTQLFLNEEENQPEAGEAVYIIDKLDNIIKRLPELDRMLNEQAAGWITSRMGKVDLTILRLAVYEMRFDPDIPVGVAINEAVELAKKFGQDNSSAFVNGVLSKFAKLEEPKGSK